MMAGENPELMPLSELNEAVHMWLNRGATEAKHLTEKRELSQKIAQMECSTFEMEKVIDGLKLHNNDLVRRVVQYQEKYEFSQKCIKQLEDEIKTHKPAHCDHEEICRFYQYDQKIVIHSCPPCMRNREGCAECAYDSRKQPR